MSLRHLLPEQATGLSAPFFSSALLMFWTFLQAFQPFPVLMHCEGFFGTQTVWIENKAGAIMAIMHN